MNKLFTLVLALPVAAAFAACSSGTGVTTPSLGEGGTETDGGPSGSDAPSGGTQCTQARKDLLVPIAKTSTGEVNVLTDTGGVKTIYVDASAGGFQNAIKNPRVYIDLETAARVDVTDDAAFESADWDLSLKRVVLYTNSGDAGKGKGGAAIVTKAFDAVTAADADGATITPEAFFDDACVPQKDRTDAVLTTFSDWYDYDEATRIPTPKKNTTFIVRGHDGVKRFKVSIEAYDANPDGSSRNNVATGYYLLKVATL